MDSSLICQFCHAETKRSNLIKIGGYSCCILCSGFVKAINAPYDPWLNPAYIENRKRINERYPLINQVLLKNVMRKFVRETGFSGSFHTKDEIINVLINLRQYLYKKYNSEIRSFERYFLLNETLNMLDFLYTSGTVRTFQASRNKSELTKSLLNQNMAINENMATLGKSLEWILECALSFDNFSSNAGMTRQSLMSLIELANEINFINTIIEQVLGMWRRGNLFINQNFYRWQLSAEDQIIHDNITNNMAEDDIKHGRIAFGDNDENWKIDEYIDELKRLNENSKITGNSILGFDEEEFICSINYLHKIHFGHKYSELLSTLLIIGQLPKIKDRDWIFQDEILEFMFEKLGYSNDISISILNHLSISYDYIQSENPRPFEFKRKYRLSRRPLPRIVVGSRVTYYLSPFILFRAFLNLQAEYTGGYNPEIIGTEIEKEIRRLNQSYSDYFVRERILPLFNKYGFIADYHIREIKAFNLEKECGEIDILAFNKNRNELIIGECKRRVGRHIHVSQIRHEIESFTKMNGFMQVLNNKLKWIKEHNEEVSDHLKLPSSELEIDYKPIFITNYYSPVSEFVKEIEFVAELNLDSWLKKRMS